LRGPEITPPAGRWISTESRGWTKENLLGEDEFIPVSIIKGCKMIGYYTQFHERMGQNAFLPGGKAGWQEIPANPSYRLQLRN
jgi:hypothetical protein